MGVWSPRKQETRWDPELRPLHEKDQLNNLARCIAAIGSDNRVAIGTAGGLFTCGRESDYGLGPQGRDIRALCPIGNEALWVLAWPGGVERWTGGGWADFRPQQPPGFPLALAVGQDGSPYVVTGRSLWRLGAGEPVEVAGPPPAPARCLAQAPEGSWWLGTTRGVYRLAGGGWELAGQQQGPLQAEVHALAVIEATLWAATDAGLWAWHQDFPPRPAGQPPGWQPHAGSGAGADPRVLALAPAAGSGNLWLARDDGVVRYDPSTGTLSPPYTVINSGLAGRRVTALAECAGALWIATQAGVSRLKLT
jgi:ligand-binding sensor domain-containing protein